VELRVSLCIAAQVLSVTLSPQPVAAGSTQAKGSGQGSICEIDEKTHKKCGVTLPVESGAELPFRLSAGYLIMVEGQIGTQRNLRFILDTGATMSIVDKKIADKLNLSRHPIKSFNFDRKLTWEQAEFHEVQFGPVKATKIAMLVGHLAEYSEFARNADAIIGTDLLKLSNFSIDYEARRIVFHLRGLESSFARGEPLSDCLTLEVLVQGHPVRLIIDTGLPGILLYEERLLTSVPGLQLTGTAINVTMGGRLHAKQVTLHGIAIGPTDKEVSVLLMKSPPPDMLPGIVGIVGIAALNARRVNFDFARGTLSWE
jgi:predicted aspartyl protease